MQYSQLCAAGLSQLSKCSILLFSIKQRVEHIQSQPMRGDIQFPLLNLFQPRDRVLPAPALLLTIIQFYHINSRCLCLQVEPRDTITTCQWQTASSRSEARSASVNALSKRRNGTKPKLQPRGTRQRRVRERGRRPHMKLHRGPSYNSLASYREPQ